MTSTATIPPFNGTGHEWQEFFSSLLIAIHGVGEYERVPDQDRGDLGIEAYSFSGRVYQCYAVQAGLTVTKRYEKQRDKMTEDIGKFCERQEDFAALLGDVQVTSWVFVVPRAESKRLLQHATAQTKRLRDAALPYASPDIRAVVITQDDLAPFILSLNRLSAQKISLAPRPPSDGDVKALEDAQPIQIHNLTEKLERLYKGRPQALKLDRRSGMMRARLLCENLLDDLRDAAPETLSRIRSLIQARYRRLEVFGPTEGTPRSVLEEEISRLSDDLAAQASELDLNERELLVDGTVALWLMLCPLDFI